MNEEPRPRRQREIPRYAPVVFDDTEDYEDEPYDYDDDEFGEGPGGDEPPGPPRRGGRGPGGRGFGGRGFGGGGGPGRGRGPGDYASDAGLFRIMALIAFLGFVIVALVLPWSPISVVGGGNGGDDGDISTEVRDDLPPLPPGMVALSRMYDITIPDGVQGPWTIEVRLDRQTDDGRNLAYYSYEEGRWQRLVSVELTDGGTRASGVLSEAPGSIAVLRREATAASLGLLIDAGDEPDQAALNGASIIAVRGASVGADGELTIDSEGVSTTRGGAGAVPVYLGITGSADGVLGAPAAISAHAQAIAAAVDANQFSGAYLQYDAVPAGSSAALASLVEELAGLLDDTRGVIVGVPVADGAGYDWAALLTSAQAIWLRPPDDPTTYYQQVEDVLGQQFAAGVDLSQVSLVIDRRSTVQSTGGTARITLQAALTPASAVDRGIEGGISAGDPVTLRAVNLETNPAGPALRWDPATRTVTYQYTTDDGQRTIWIENRYSIGFRLEVAQRYGLGGVVIDPAAANPELPAIWEPVLAFVADGEVTLEQPYGPYLVPCWQASAGEIEGASECWQSSEPSDAVVWRAPAQPGAYDIRLVVSDGTVFVAQELALNVAAEATPTPTPTEEPEPEPTEEPEPEPEPTEEPEPTQEPEPEPTEDVPPGPAGDDD